MLLEAAHQETQGTQVPLAMMVAAVLEVLEVSLLILLMEILTDSILAVVLAQVEAGTTEMGAPGTWEALEIAAVLAAHHQLFVITFLEGTPGTGEALATEEQGAQLHVAAIHLRQTQEPHLIPV
jgi:hypothetical protein